MRKINILAAVIILAVFAVGCTSDGGIQPPSEVLSNVYLPESPAGRFEEIGFEQDTIINSFTDKTILSSAKIRPNVYLPKNSADLCEEIEIEWYTVMGGKESSFHSGREDLCLSLKGLNKKLNPSIRIRCVVRNPNGSLIASGPWVDGIKAASRKEFLEICPTTKSAGSLVLIGGMN